MPAVRDRRNRSSNRLIGKRLIAHSDGVSLSSSDIDTKRAKCSGTRVLWSAAKNIGAPRNFDLGETLFGQERDELCFQQSAGDSAGPEIDASLR